MTIRYSTIGTALVLALVVSSAVAAQDAPFTWDNSTEFAFVSTSGNASSTTLGLKSTLSGADERQSFKLEIGGIRASSNFTTRTATGTTGDFVVTKETRTEQSAANYFARSRFDRNIKSAFAFGGAGWQRNTFSGVNHRFSLVAGMGKTFVESETGLFKADLGATYTVQKDVTPDPTKNEGFGGARATIEASRAVTSTTDLATIVLIDENLRTTEDLRIDWVASIAVALTEGLAFKTSFQILFDNDPALVGIPLLDGGGLPTGESVQVPSQKVDSFLTLSLVIKL
jgi:putative salt-induced outer membrane protein YdiY